MASSSPEPSSEAGFATPAATMVSLAIALVATAVTALAVAQLHLARHDLSRARTEYALIGGQEIAAVTTLQNTDAARLAWQINSPAGPLQALAEPEAVKLSPASALALPDADLVKFGVADPNSFRLRLQALIRKPPVTAAELEDADASSFWRLCSRTVVSPYGTAKTLLPVKTQAPTNGDISSRAGEVWRMRVGSQDDWVDDRLVRFTGDGAHPAAVIERRFYRRSNKEGSCDALVAPNPTL